MSDAAAEAREPFLEAPHRALRRRVAEFVQERLLPANLDEKATNAPRRFLDLLAADDLLELVLPDGGGMPDLRSLCVVREELAWASGLADLMFAMQGLGSHPLRLAGDEALREAILPGLRSGEQIAAIAITEPEAGSDLGGIRVRANRDGGDYVIDGEKIFISNAGHATFYSVLVRTGSEADGRHGLAFLLVEADRPGLRVEPLSLLSPHPIGRVLFDGVRVPADHLLGKEGEGFDLALRTLNFFRPTVGAAAVGFATRALDEARTHVRARRQFGRALSEFQGVQHMLADMATDVEAARLLVHRAAAGVDAGRDAPMEASMAKLFATECAGRVVDRAVQLLGAKGLVEGTPVERLYREVRGLRIYEGTSEIQRNLIAREILRR